MALDVYFRDDIAQAAASTLASFIVGQSTSGAPNMQAISVAMLLMLSHAASFGVSSSTVLSLTNDIFDQSGNTMGQSLLTACTQLALAH